MLSVTLLSALLAIGLGLVSGDLCSDDLVITDANQRIPCKVVEGSVTVDSKVSGNLRIEGPTQFQKDFTVSNASNLIGISSSTLEVINGTMKLQDLPFLNTVDLQCHTVENLELIKLPQLNNLTFGKSGLTHSRSIIITDTFITDLSGFTMTTVETIEISNNPKLTTFDNPHLVNITKSLKLTNNGNNMQVKLLNLTTAGDIQLLQVTSFNGSSLKQVESIKINDSPDLTNVSVNELKDITASLTFINNKSLKTLSFQSLTSIKGDMTIQNNTALTAIDGFPKLNSVGTIELRGNFASVTLPELNDVRGSARAKSTTDIESFCAFFKDLKDQNRIRGKMSCESNNKNANEGDGSDGSSSGDKKKDAAGIVSVNTAMLGLALFAAIAHML